MKNKVYQTSEITRYFSENRVAWDQFYKSERVIIENLGLDSKTSVLDIGSGCGGLGIALKEKLGLTDYTGVEINTAAAEIGRMMNPDAKILTGDILELNHELCGVGHFYDVVFSLSCIDWNTSFSAMLDVAWNLVQPGGYFVATFRLTDDSGCNNIKQSFQYINYDGQLSGEIASYVVLNANELLFQLMSYNPHSIDAYGYWGSPSPSAVTPYKQLCFAAFSIRKKYAIPNFESPILSLELPSEIKNALVL